MIGSGVGVLALAAILVLSALEDSVVFFYSPSKVAEGGLVEGQRFRLGGLVAEGSVKRGEGTKVGFAITDTLKTYTVSFDGVLPDLFREGQGVSEGHLGPDNVFIADTVLAKHDETYMPPEVAAALKEQGVKLGQGATHPGSKAQ